MQARALSAGVPSTFIRLATCNLRCSWCDTAYTWDWDHFDKTEQCSIRRGNGVIEIAELAPKNVVIHRRRAANPAPPARPARQGA